MKENNLQAEQESGLLDLEPKIDVKGGNTGTGQIMLNGANTYTGATTVNAQTPNGSSRDVWTSGVGSVDIHY